MCEVGLFARLVSRSLEQVFAEPFAVHAHASLSSVADQLVGREADSTFTSELELKSLFDLDRPGLFIEPWLPSHSGDHLVEVDDVHRDNGWSVLVPSQVLDRQGQWPAGVWTLSGTPTIIVVGPPGIEGPHQAFRTAFVGFAPAAVTSTPTRFFKIPDMENLSHADVIRDFETLLRKREGRTKWGFVTSRLHAPQGSLHFEDNDPEVRRRIEELHEFGEATTVGDVFEVLRATVNPEAVDQGEDTRVLSPHELLPDGELVPPNGRTGVVPPGYQGVHLRVDDMLLREFQQPTGQRPFAVDQASLPLTAGPNILVLRPRQALTWAERTFYRLYLGSTRLYEVARAQSIGHLHRLRNVEHLPLPHPDEDLVAALEELESAEQQLVRWAANSRGVLRRAFDAGSAAEARAKIINVGREYRQRVEAADRVGSLGYRIETFYPYPLAHKWRVVQVKTHEGDEREAYAAVLNCYETLMSFMAALALAHTHLVDSDLGAMRAVRRKLSTAPAGVGIGDWVNILKEVGSGPAEQLATDGSPLAIVTTFLPQRGCVADAQARLSRRRNDESHQRNVDPLRLTEELASATADLETLLNAASFLADLPLLLVKANQWDSLQGKGTVVADLLRGDHPVPDSETSAHDTAHLEVGSIYIREGAGRYVLLRPFLIHKRCPTCGSLSIFHPGRRMNGRVMLKAIEHTHEVDGSSFEDALRHVGYLE